MYAGGCRETLTGDSMRRSKEPAVEALYKSLEELTNMMSAYWHTGSTELCADQQFSHECKDVSLLFTREAQVPAVMYHRREMLAEYGLRVVSTGSAGNNCMINSILRSMIAHIKLLELERAPKFFNEGASQQSWAFWVQRQGGKHLDPVAEQLRSKTLAWMKQNAAGLKQRIEWAAKHGVNSANSDSAESGGLASDVDREIQALETGGFLGEISMGAVVTVMHLEDPDFFREHEFKVILYGARGVSNIPDRLIEILPHELQYSPKHYVEQANKLQDAGRGGPARGSDAELVSQRLVARVCGDLNERFGTAVRTRLVQVKELAGMKLAMFANTQLRFHFEAMVFAGQKAPVQYRVDDVIVGLNPMLGMSFWTGLPRFSRSPMPRPSNDLFTQQASTQIPGVMSEIKVARDQATAKRKKQAGSKETGKVSGSAQDLGLLDPPSAQAADAYNFLDRPDSRDAADAEALRVRVRRRGEQRMGEE
jgi:hypothetical protein